MSGEDRQTAVNSIVPQHEIILYQMDNTNVCINVIFEDETFWLSQSGMAELFDVNSQAISRHLSNIYEEEELQKEATCSKKEQVQNEGNRTVKRKIDYDNLDAIVAVGYRVSSKKAVNEYKEFRVKQDEKYISEFDKQMRKYLKGEES